MQVEATTDALDRLVEAHRDVYTSLLDLCEELDDMQWSRATGCPGWSVRDCLAHVVGLEGVMAGDPEPHATAVDGPHIRTDLDRYVAQHIVARRYLDVPDLLLEARDVFSRRLGQLDLVTSPDEEVPAIRGASGPAARVLAIRVVDLWAHEQDIRRAVGVAGHVEGPAPRLARDRLLRGLARQLPRRLGHPAASLVLAITAPNAVVWALDLEQGVVITPPPEPTVRLTLPFEHFVARACGRADAPDLDLALVHGEAALARAVLAAFAVTP